MHPWWRGFRIIVLVALALPLVRALAAAQPPALSDGNLISNPSFSGGLAGWTLIGTVQASSHGRTDSASAGLGTSLYWAGVQQIVPVTPLASYRANAYFYLQFPINANSPQVLIVWLTAQGQILRTDTSTAPALNAGWEAASINVQAPIGAARAQVQAQANIKGVADQPHAFIDDVSLVLTAPPPTLTPTAPSTATRTSSPTASITPTRTHTPTATATDPPQPTATPTRPAPTGTATATARPATAISTSSPTPTSSATPTPSGLILINEVEYNSLHNDVEAYYEWFEIYNPAATALQLSGWTIGDNYSSNVLPDVTLASGALGVVAARRVNFMENYPDFAGLLVELGQPIGNGLANSGDRLLLRNAAGQLVDAMSFGSDNAVFSPPCPTVTIKGHSLERRPLGRNTQQASDFQEQEQPSPGRAWDAVLASPTATATFSPSPSPTATATSSATATPEDTATATETPTPTPSLPPAEPSHTPSPSASATATADDTPTATFTASASATMTPSPTSSGTATATPTTMPSASVTATATPTATATAGRWTLFLPLVVFEPTPTPTPTRTPDPHLVTLNEILPNPYQIDWNGNGQMDTGDKWLELYNGADVAADVSGWALDDEPDAGSKMYFLPAGSVIPAHGFLLVFSRESGLHFATTKDVVRLLYKDGTLWDSYQYWATWHDRSFSKTVDGGREWTYWYPPSPGQPNRQ